MGRKNSSTWKSIHVICRIHHIDEDVLYVKTKMVLKTYHVVCWSAGRREQELRETITESSGMNLGQALTYLETFAPEAEKERFLDQVGGLFETRWMLELIENAMLHVREFPKYGSCYYELLEKKYLSRFIYTEQEMIELLNLERSRYYDKMQEAIMVFGISLWGFAIPNMKQFLSDHLPEEMGDSMYA